MAKEKKGKSIVDDVMSELDDKPSPAKKAEKKAEPEKVETGKEIVQISQNYRILDISKIKAWKDNRKVDPDQLEELKKSIGSIGQLVPIIVDQDFTIIEGERRFRAMQDLGVKKIRALVQDNHKEVTRVVTNVLRENFSPEFLQSIFKKELKRKGMTQAKLAEMMGLTQGRVSQIVNFNPEKSKGDVEKCTSVKLDPAEGLSIKVTSKKVTVTIVLSNDELTSPVKTITNRCKEFSWRKGIANARNGLDI